ncbi:MAG: DUF3048 domain-containing protein [Patescibacteria group bacterium]
MNLKEVVQRYLEAKKQAPSANWMALLIFVALFLLAWTVFAVVWVLATRVPERPVEADAPQIVTSTPVIVSSQRLLDGVSVDSENLTAEPIVAVMIDMHRDAHPVSGVDRAPLVYEVPVEGGINRLVALFTAHDAVEEAGPVRSARPYFVDIAGEYNALYMHVGGSPEAVKQLRRRDDVYNLDQWYHSQFYWLDRRRAAPHHVYTSSSRWLAAVEERAVASSTFGMWRYDASEPPAGGGWQPAPEIAIVSVNNRSSVWRWDGAAFVRLSGDKPYRTRNGGAIAVNTIIVQQVAQRVLDAEGRLALDTDGEGFAWVFRDGAFIRGFWKYSRKEHRTRWYDDSGEEIALKPGRLWVHLAPLGVEPRVVLPAAPQR